MSRRAPRPRLARSLSLALAAATFLAACVGGDVRGRAAGDPSGQPPAPDGGSGPEQPPPAPQPATATFQAVAITSLAGASPSPGVAGTFKPEAMAPGGGRPPALSNSVLSAVPGAPPKPLFVGQDAPFDAVLIAVEGQSGYFEVPTDGLAVAALDLVAATAARGNANVLVATRTGTAISAPASLQLLVDPYIFVAAGDLENHDTDESNVADLFGAFLEGKQGAPAVAAQVIEGEDNNDVVVDGIKGRVGPVATGHREVVWDGVPEVLRNKANFNQAFFDRQPDDRAGVRGGVVFAATGGTGQEVNDALDGVLPDATTVGPPANDNTSLGGDFSNVNASYAGDLLAFTQPAQFATRGTVTTDITFTVAGSDQKAVVNGLGVVFASVDKGGVTTVEYFDENEQLIKKIEAPVQSFGPFPFPGPAVADRFPFSFVGYVVPGARIAHVRITAGDVPIDLAAEDMGAGGQDVVTFDDIYYGEPNP